MPARIPLIAGNWKMNLEEWAAVELAGSIADGLPNGTADVVVCPPFPWLVPVSAVLEGSRVALGAQDCSAEASGAFTGQVSATMLNGLCRYVIVGHSERRRDNCESNQLVGRKALAAIGAATHADRLCRRSARCPRCWKCRSMGGRASRFDRRCAGLGTPCPSFDRLRANLGDRNRPVGVCRGCRGNCLCHSRSGWSKPIRTARNRCAFCMEAARTLQTPAHTSALPTSMVCWSGAQA